MPFVSTKSLDIYYERYGTGPTVLNVSGAGGDLRRTRPDVSPLNKHFDVVHYDQRGFGQTSKPDVECAMSDYATDAYQLMDELDIGRAHIVGMSFGGMVALHIALLYPEVVQKLVLCCTSPGGLLPSFPLHILQQLDSEARLEMRLGLLDNRWDPSAADPIPGLGNIYDEIIEDARMAQGSEAEIGSKRQLEARAGHDVLARLHEIQTKTLVCAGEYDDLAPVANSIALTEGIPDAQLRVFQGGHLFMLQDRNAMTEIVSFLDT